jgi:hypothetical protein
MISNATPLFENNLNTKKPQKTLKSNLEHFLHFVGPKTLSQCPSLLECETHLSGKNTDFRRNKPLYYFYTHCGAKLPPKICSGRHNY